MYGAHQGTSQTRALAHAKQVCHIQWGNKRKKMQKNKQIKYMLKIASESK